jgi:hypothetical protein
VALRLDRFGWEALEETADRHGLAVGEVVSAACRRFLAHEPLPSLAGRRQTGTWGWVSVDLGPAELAALESRARRHRTAFEMLLRESVTALIAELDSGRLGVEMVAADYPVDEASA